jgi:hypothetical protein
MKRITYLPMAVFSCLVLACMGAGFRGGGGGGFRGGGGFHASAPMWQPMIIHMNRPSSGGFNRNFPSQQASRSGGGTYQPSYGQFHWNTRSSSRRQAWVSPISSPRPHVSSYASPGVRAAVAVHHHAYTQGYVRQKLRKIGVKTEPSFITDRSEIIHTDRAHSTIAFPQRGPDGRALPGSVVSSRHFNDPVVRDRMALVDGAGWRGRIGGFEASETGRGRYYWHTGDGFNYCHYVDNWGYHWWGWYAGSQFFWTRNYDGRWWWYDTGYNRWCFWNNGYWWWQDPYHLGDLYCYDDSDYIPCNSADDQEVVTANDSSNDDAYYSPDNTRVVKVDRETHDAFLYDTTDPPSFEPVYLASGVAGVQFSANNGRPMEIVLKLNDGSFDVFDGQGNSYSPGNFDADQADQASAQ